ncbi:MAG: hypothetical protein ABH824_02620 [Nanoarchaeota archaeon]|nr:hypothetical protein [Nanoarchaeota archaeon]MBU1632124.1 hypothetical protein [Nanoarchaeota archaeon]MBU1876189.1 hypothetical protein [Nanoarchaeota archaeon]
MSKKRGEPRSKKVDVARSRSKQKKRTKRKILKVKKVKKIERPVKVIKKKLISKKTKKIEKKEKRKIARKKIKKVHKKTRAVKKPGKAQRIKAKSPKTPQHKNKKIFFSIIFALGFLLSLLPFIKVDYFIFSFIGLPLILLSFYSYHYLTSINEKKVFEKKKRKIDYISLFLFVVFLMFTILFFFMHKWFLMIWGFLLIFLTVLFYNYLIRKKANIKKVLIIIAILIFAFVLSTILFTFIKFYQFFNLAVINNYLDGFYKYLKSIANYQTAILLSSIAAAVFLVILIFLKFKRRIKTEEAKKEELVAGEEVVKGIKEIEKNSGKKEVGKIQLRKTRLGETSIDLLYNLLKERGKLDIVQIARIFDITPKQAEEWGKILEKNDLAELHFPLFGGPLLRVIKKQEENKEQLKSVAQQKPKGKTEKDVKIKRELETVKPAEEPKVEEKERKEKIEEKIEKKSLQQLEVESKEVEKQNEEIKEEVKQTEEVNEDEPKEKKETSPTKTDNKNLEKTHKMVGFLAAKESEEQEPPEQPLEEEEKKGQEKEEKEEKNKQVKRTKQTKRNKANKNNNHKKK